MSEMEVVVRTIRAGEENAIIGIREVALVPGDPAGFGTTGVRFGEVASWLLNGRVADAVMFDMVSAATTETEDVNAAVKRMIAYAQGAARSDAQALTHGFHERGASIGSTNGRSVRISIREDERGPAEIAFVVAPERLEAVEESVHCHATLRLGIDVLTRLGIETPPLLKVRLRELTGEAHFPVPSARVLIQ